MSFEWMAIVVYILLIYVIFTLFGYEITTLFFKPVKNDTPQIIQLVFYCIIGLFISIPLGVILALFLLVDLLIPLMIIFSALLILNSIITKRALLENIIPSKSVVYSFFKRNQFFILAFFFIVVYMSLSIQIMVLLPPGDCNATHGPLTALIFEYNGLPLDNGQTMYQLFYHPGTHIISAAFAKSFIIRPDLALLIVTGSILSLLPLVVMGLAWLLTKNDYVSFICGVFTLWVHPQGALMKYPFGPFINGTFSSLVGTVLFVSVIFLWCFIDDKNIDVNHDNKQIILLGVFFISCFAIGFTYPIFALLIGIAFIFQIFFSRRILVKYIKKFFTNINEIHLLITITFIPLLALIFLQRELILDIGNQVIHYIIGISTVNSERISAVLTNPSYYVTLSHFLSGPLTMILMIIPILVLILYFKRVEVKLPIVFYTFAVICFFISNLTIPVLLPSRFVFPLSAMSIPVLFYCLTNIPQLNSNEILHRVKILKRIKTTTLIGILMVFAFMPWSFAYHATFSPAIRSNYLTSGNPDFEYDYDGLTWLIENTNQNDFILNDGSFLSRSIPSLQWRNVSLWAWNEFRNHNRTYNLYDLWDNLDNRSIVVDALFRSKITVIISCNAYYYLKRIPTNSYTIRPYSPAECYEILEQYSFLSRVYSFGNGGIWNVNYTSLILELDSIS